MHEFRIPRLGLGDDEEVRVLAWHVEEGAVLQRGDALLEIETDKAAMDVEAPTDGVLALTVLRPGAAAAVGSLAAFIADADETYERRELQQRSESTADLTPSQDAGGHIAPPARAIRDRVGGLDARRLTGRVDQPSVENGDLRGFSRPRAGQPVARDSGNHDERGGLHASLEGLGPYREAALSGRRAGIARSMTLSAVVPQFAVARRLDVTSLADTVHTLRNRDVPATLTDAFIWCVAQALTEVPPLNAWFDGRHLYEFERPNLAVAVDTEDGVAAPVVHDVTAKSFVDVVAERARLVEAARTGAMTARETTGATFTLSNVGPLGSDILHPLVTPPQTGVLGLGRARRSGTDGARWLTAVLVADHRTVDGADGARFLAALSDEIESFDAATVTSSQPPVGAPPNPPWLDEGGG